MANSFSDQTRAGEMHGWHVYVLSEEGDGFCKIGSALNVKYRVDGLRNGNPRRLTVVADWHFDSRDAARAVESRALKSAEVSRIPKRDWLKLSCKDAISFVERAVAEYGLNPKSITK